jgi:hypothetical protein
MCRAHIQVAATVAATLIVAVSSLVSAQDWTTLWKDPAVVNYELTMEKVRKVAEVLRTVASDAGATAQLDRDFKDLSKTKPKPTVAEVSALIEQQPAARNAISKAGLTTRDYLLSAAAMTNAAVYMTLRSQSQSAAPPQSAAQTANVSLLEKNQAEWKKIEQELAQIGAKAPPSPKR